MGLENLNIKNTLKEPTEIGKKTNKDFRQQIIKRDVNLDILKETDSMLNEEELSFKRKIFKLSKMEALVHGDPKLSAVYEKMAIEGRDKYGYHWNETLMNIIFNDYVLNSPKYLQKYKMTVPVKKKRRDDSGINQLKKKIRKSKRLPVENEKSKEKNESNNMEMPLKEDQNNEYLDITTPVGSEDDKLFVSVVNKGIDSHLEAFTKSKFDVKVDYLGRRRIYKFHRSELPILIRRLEEIGDENALQWAEDIKNDGNSDMTETTGAASSGSFAPALDTKLYETTTSSSSGAYSTPVAWAKNGEKPRMSNKPIWKGGVILESAKKDGSYLTDSRVFQEYVKALDEGVKDDPCWDGYEMIGMKKRGGKEVPNCVPEGTSLSNDDGRVSMSEEKVDEALNPFTFNNVENLKFKISNLLTSNKELFKKIKKFHEEMDDQSIVTQLLANTDRIPIKKMVSNPDAYAEVLISTLAQYSVLFDRKLENNPQIVRQLKSIDAIIDPDLLKIMNESENMNEHHAFTKEDKIAFILKNKDKVFQGNVSPTVDQDLASMSDAEIDALYDSAESAMGISETNNLMNEDAPALSLDGLVDWASKNILYSTNDPSELINSFAQQNNISIEKLRDKAKLYAKNAALGLVPNGASVNDILMDLVRHIDNEMIGIEQKQNTRKMEPTNESNEKSDVYYEIEVRLRPTDSTLPYSELQDISNEYDVDFKDVLNTLGQVLSDRENRSTEDSKYIVSNVLKELNHGIEKAVSFDELMNYISNNYNSDEYDADQLEIAYDKLTKDPNQLSLFEKAVSQKQQKFMGMVRAAQKGEMENPSPAVAKAAASMKPSDVKDFASTLHKDLSEKVEESTGFNKNVVKGKVESKPVKTGDNTKQWKTPVKESIIDPQNPSMVSGNGTSMVKEPSAPAVSSVGGVGESLEESINKELSFYKKHLNKLNKMVNEERRHPALVNLDRVKDANEKNFKSDIKDSNIGDVIDMESQPMASELTQEVGDNPYKLAQDIEKESLKKTKGEALKNVGNSANEEGDEIPKRNLSKEEMLAVAMNRGKGMQDIVYDNEPSEKFEKRMKTDFGDDIYKLRQDKMKYQAKAPMYNKDAQPIGDKLDVGENNKYGRGYNNESISGRYTDEFGKKKFLDFKLNETIEISKVDSSYQQVLTDGMGNTYTSKIEENRSFNDFTNSYNLFHKNGKIYRVKKIQSINEGVEKQSHKVENMDKMKHLMGYNPSKYLVNKKIK